MKITLSQLRSLQAATRSGGVGAAARRLNMTQSAVSQAIITLERALGITLLTRTRNGMVPTALAHDVLKYAEIALAAVERIEGFASASAPRKGGSLRIASVPSAAAGLLPRWKRRFLNLYPDTKVSVFEGNHVEVGDWVADGVADLGLTSIVPPALRAADIRREEMVVVARRGHPVLRPGAVSVPDLHGQVLLTSSPGCDRIIRKLLASVDGPPPRSIRVHDMKTTLEMVRQGIGVTVVPETALSLFDMLDLRSAGFAPPAYRHLFCVNALGGEAAELVDAFIGVARETASAPSEPAVQQA